MQVMKNILPPSSVVGTMVTSPIATPCFVILITVCVEFTYWITRNLCKIIWILLFLMHCIKLRIILRLNFLRRRRTYLWLGYSWHRFLYHWDCPSHRHGRQWVDPLRPETLAAYEVLKYHDHHLHLRPFRLCYTVRMVHISFLDHRPDYMDIIISEVYNYLGYIKSMQ